MAKNIDFMGAIFPDVPSVKLPQQGGGLVSFDDTTDATATADKILQGYTAYANGQKLVGTASGGITPSGTISITQNGQVDVTQYAIADVNVSGGGGEISPFFHKQFDIPNTTSTTPVNIEEVQFPDELVDDEHILYFVSRYVGTVPNNHYIGSEISGTHAFYSTHSFAFGGAVRKMDANGQIKYANATTAGVIPVMNSGKLYVRYCYSANATSAIGGTYDVKIYMIPKPIQP